MDLIYFIIAALYVEAVTEILVSSELFFPLRDKLSRRGHLLGVFVNCGYCVSVWVSITIVWVLPRIFDNPVDIIFRLFIIHRLANVIHEAFSRWFHRVPWVFIISKPDDKPQGQPSVLGSDDTPVVILEDQSNSHGKTQSEDSSS